MARIVGLGVNKKAPKKEDIENEALKAKIAELEKENVELINSVTDAQKENEALNVKVEELEKEVESLKAKAEAKEVKEDKAADTTAKEDKKN